MKPSTRYQNTSDTNKHLSDGGVLFKYSLVYCYHSPSCSVVILSSLFSWLVTRPLLCHFTESIKLSVQTRTENTGIWFTDDRLPVRPLHREMLCSDTRECLNRSRRRRGDTAGTEADWFYFYWSRDGKACHLITFWCSTKWYQGESCMFSLKTLLINTFFNNRDGLTEIHHQLCSFTETFSLF